MSKEEILKLLKEFFDILDRVEESDNGMEFYPVRISSCRVMLSKRIGEIFDKLKGEIND